MARRRARVLVLAVLAVFAVIAGVTVPIGVRMRADAPAPDATHRDGASANHRTGRRAPPPVTA